MRPVGGAAWVEVLLVSAAPIGELRAGIPLGLALGLSPVVAFGAALAGNLLPVPLLLWGLRALWPLILRWPGPLGRWAHRYQNWQRKRLGRRWARWGPWALMLFVAIPLPGSGAWTGALLAALVGIPPQRALMPIVLGVVVAGVLVLMASLGVWALL